MCLKQNSLYLRTDQYSFQSLSNAVFVWWYLHMLWIRVLILGTAPQICSHPEHIYPSSVLIIILCFGSAQDSRNQTSTQSFLRRIRGQGLEARSGSQPASLLPLRQQRHRFPEICLANANPETYLANASPETCLANASPETCLANASPETCLANANEQTAGRRTKPWRRRRARCCLACSRSWSCKA